MTAAEYHSKFYAMTPRELIAYFKSSDSRGIGLDGYIPLAIVAIRHLEDALDRSDFEASALEFDPDEPPIVAEAASDVSAYWDSRVGVWRETKSLQRARRLHKPPTDDEIAEEYEVRP